MFYPRGAVPNGALRNPQAIAYLPRPDKHADETIAFGRLPERNDRQSNNITVGFILKRTAVGHAVHLKSVPQFPKAMGRAVMEKERLIVTVIGEDRKGIVARISTFLYESGINILDINQKIMESYFVMAMLVDMKESNIPLEGVRTGLEKIGKEMGVLVQIQHENIFKMMHRV
jgi:ACT domain-containing protein